MKVLIIEDDKKLAATYKNILSSSFDITILHDLNSVKRVIKSSKNIDVILVDIMLPDGLGYNIIPFIKDKSNAIVIIISALEKEETRRIAYEKGADDYMIKPITLFELEYKLKAIKKRLKNDGFVYHVGDLRLDFENLTLSTDYNALTIQYSQGILFKMLCEKYKMGQILHKNELSNFKNGIDDFRIHTLISRLRKSIEELESEQVFIENVYGKGYQLVVLK